MVVKCKHCGYKWVPRVEKPKQCPKCKRYLLPATIYQVVSEFGDTLFSTTSEVTAKKVLNSLSNIGMKVFIKKKIEKGYGYTVIKSDKNENKNI